MSVNNVYSQGARQIKPTTLAVGLMHYKKTVSILKKGYEQERYRIVQILRSTLSNVFVHEITSVDIAAYRDMRLQSLNQKTGNPLSPATIRLEMSLLSNFFELARIEWGYTDRPNPCADVPLSSKARDALTRLGIKQQGPIFHYTKHGIKSTWRVLCLRLGIEDLHFHDMRHEAISRLFELGTLDMMEIAAISGHKSLSMLKRYTHLRANKLVHKLEGTKKKAQLAILNHLVPYPGILVTKQTGLSVVFPDFDENQVIMTPDAKTADNAVVAAQDLLLRTLLSIIREGRRLPPPDHYLESPHHGPVVMIDPMATA